MSINRIKLYAILLIACLAGYIWLFYGMKKLHSEGNTFEVCLIKHTTNIPCPSCGSTRSVLSLIDGDPLKALYINPFGIIVASIMLITPVWILFDIITKKKTLFNFYRQTEIVLKKPKVSILLIVVVLINWIWNITKEL